MVVMRPSELFVRASDAGLERTCPFCRGAILTSERAWTCRGCATVHHEECARENGACTVMGCGRRLETVAPAATRRPLLLAIANVVLKALAFPIIALAAALVVTIAGGPTFGSPILVACLFVGITLWGTASDRVSAARELERETSPPK
jgi:hypothetical protein